MDMTRKRKRVVEADAKQTRIREGFGKSLGAIASYDELHSVFSHSVNSSSSSSSFSFASAAAESKQVKQEVQQQQQQRQQAVSTTVHQLLSQYLLGGDESPYETRRACLLIRALMDQDGSSSGGACIPPAAVRCLFARLIHIQTSSAVSRQIYETLKYLQMRSFELHGAPLWAPQRLDWRLFEHVIGIISEPEQAVTLRTLLEERRRERADLDFLVGALASEDEFDPDKLSADEAKAQRVAVLQFQAQILSKAVLMLKFFTSSFVADVEHRQSRGVQLSTSLLCQLICQASNVSSSKVAAGDNNVNNAQLEAALVRFLSLTGRLQHVALNAKHAAGSAWHSQALLKQQVSDVASALQRMIGLCYPAMAG
jgi:hypothetical protein